MCLIVPSSGSISTPCRKIGLLVPSAPKRRGASSCLHSSGRWWFSPLGGPCSGTSPWQGLLIGLYGGWAEARTPRQPDPTGVEKVSRPAVLRRPRRARQGIVADEHQLPLRTGSACLCLKAGVSERPTSPQRSRASVRRGSCQPGAASSLRGPGLCAVDGGALESRTGGGGTPDYQQFELAFPPIVLMSKGRPSPNGGFCER